MRSSYIDYNETGYFSSTVISYLKQDPNLVPFFAYQPTIEGFRQLLGTKKVTADRSLLVEVLMEQYSKNIGLDTDGLTPVINNINLLGDQNTYTVTTGHQLNLFTGPLYFLFKIVTTINLARELKENFPDKNFVPVYWMATEDHDFKEINHTKVHGKLIEWKEDATGATGRLSTKTISESLKEYQNALGVSSKAEELSTLIQKAYGEHDDLAGATQYLVNSLFAEYGLVIIDADSARLKKQFVDIAKKDLIEHSSYTAITDTSGQLEALGFKTQVNAREINFFYLKDGLRERIVKEDGIYYILNSQLRFTEEELLGELHEHPERFSPNVIMRPLYQEIILPNLAYIGGGAEVVYWLQLKKNFDQYGINFPILILRNSALLADESFTTKLLRLGISHKDVFKKTEELQKNWVLKHSEHTLNLNDEWKEFSCLFEKIKLRTYKIDPTLSPSTEAVKARLRRSLSNLEKKLIKAEKRNYDSALNQIQNIRKKFFPNESLQERSENFGPLYVKYGDLLIKELIRNFRPLDFKFTILEP